MPNLEEMTVAAETPVVQFKATQKNRTKRVKMTNPEGMNVNAATPVVQLKTTQKKRTKRVLPSWLNMIPVNQGLTTKGPTSSSSQAMVMSMNSKRIAKGGKQTFKKVSIAYNFNQFMPILASRLDKEQVELGT